MAFPFIETKATKILWAVDAFHDKPREQLRVFEALTKMFGQAPMEVYPLALLQQGTYDDASGRFLEKWRELADSALKNVEKLLAQVKHPALQTPHLLRKEGFSASAATRELIRYALEENMDLIAVSSHGRKGLDRVLLGSFAETLVLQSPLPVLVVNPKSTAKSTKRLKTILFPTDFSDASQEAFTRVCALSAKIGVPILLFHKVRYFYPQLGPAFLYPTISVESAREFRQALKEKGQKWIAEASRRGAKVKLHLDAKEGQPLDELLRVARKLGPATVIAMASQTGQLGTLLLGSLTRKVLRNATNPILVLHPNQPSMVKRFSEEVAALGAEYTARPLFA